MIDAVEETAAVDMEVTDDSRLAPISQGQPILCANCQAPLQGAWCYICGQRASDTNRSVGHLFAEAFEGLTHVDSRLWRTLTRLVRAPGSLTRDYLIGKRVPQIPPFRMFLVVVLILFFAGSIGELGPLNAGSHLDSDVQGSSASSVKGTSKLVFDQSVPMARWLNSHVQRALAHPEAVARVMEHWAHQFAILSLLVAAPLMALVYVFQRKFRFYDHLIFSMHSLSFQGLLLSISMIGGGWLSWAEALLILAPVHLFAHMRGFYGGSSVGILVRMGLIFVGSVIGFIALFAALLLVGIAGVH